MGFKPQREWDARATLDPRVGAELSCWWVWRGTACQGHPPTEARPGSSPGHAQLEGRATGGGEGGEKPEQPGEARSRCSRKASTDHRSILPGGETSPTT